MIHRYGIGTIAALVASSLLMTPRTGAAAEPAETPELVANSELTRGNGIAARFVADEGINSHPNVIFADNFEQDDLGSSWDEIRNRNILSLVQGSDEAPVGRKSLRVTATLGENTGGGLTKWFASSDRVFIRFYTKFDPQCDYVHHFCTLRANKGLQGKDRWSGFGGAGKRPVGDERFSTALEPWGNWRNWPPPGRWNFYSYWHTMDQSRDGHYWGNSFRSKTQPNIKRGEWICAEMMLKHNRPGQSDGEQAYWIDGNLGGHWRGLNWRTSPTLWANAFTLESYVTDRWTRNRTNIVFFDNVVIATAYVGPAGIR